MHDSDGNGRLDFEEFYNLSKEHRWLVRDICVKYCRALVPPRAGGHMEDQTGEHQNHKFSYLRN